MARTSEEIKASIVGYIKQNDATLDCEKGALYDGFISPASQELAGLETKAEDLRKFYSPDQLTVTNKSDLEIMRKNLSLSVNTGNKTRVKQYFYSYTRPRTDVLITIGSLVGNNDMTYQYTVIEEVSVAIANVDNYYNASRKTWEFFATVEAVSSGEQYDLPSYRINRLIIPITGISGTENREDATGGKSVTGDDTLYDRIKKRYKGMNTGTPSGVASEITNYDPSSVKDVIITSPIDIEFKRIIPKPALDFYISGLVLAKDVKTILVGTTPVQEIILDKSPVKSINFVQVNGLNLPSDNSNNPSLYYGFSMDTSDESGYSARSVDKIILSTPVINSTIVISYNYNSLIYGVQTDLFSEDLLFETDLLAREFFPALLDINIYGKIMSSYSITTTRDSVISTLTSSIVTNKWVDKIIPETLRQTVLSSVPGLSTLKFNIFTRTLNGTNNIEVVEFKKNEMPVINDNNLVIKLTK